ncbi:MAG: PAS domain-containing protein [Rhodospirillaceae bacterium]|nr:PAS domain-containing protein [Rhodospirillaceae bacterium]
MGTCTIQKVTTRTGLLNFVAFGADTAVLKIVDARCQSFLDHWRTLPRRAGQIIPHSNDYLDQAPAELMPAVFIHEVLEDGLLVRFMGTKLVERWRRDDTGKMFGTHLDDAARGRLLSVVNTVVNHPCGILQHGFLATSAGRQAMFEAILLSLSVEPWQPKRLIVYSVILDVLGREEHRSRFAAAGERCWMDIGAGLPSYPIPPE